MKQSATVWCTACLLGVGALSSCTGPAGGGGSSRTDSQPVVENRVRIGGDNWIVQPAQTGPIAEAGTVETIEVTNGTDSDLSVPDAGINNAAFRLIFNGCTGVLKPGETCQVRGEWTATKAREANLEVSVSEPGAAAGAVRKGISVPLKAASNLAPEATLPPTTGSMSDLPPSPSTSTVPAPPSPTESSGRATTAPTAPPAPQTPAVGAPLKQLIPTLK